MPLTRRAPTAVFALGVATALALTVGGSITGEANTFVCDQFANISPMSGGGWAVDPCGEIEGNGAFQINIPIGYTPKAGYFVASGYFGGVPPDKSSFTNKTGIIGASIGGMPRAWLSGMVVSNTNAVGNIQVQFNKETDTMPAISAGVQSVFETDCGRWGFAVATKGFCLGSRPLYVTAGIRANTNNARGIGGVSVPINDYLGFAAEYDGLQANAALILRPTGTKCPVTLLGAYNGHAGWLAGIAVSFDVLSPGAW